MTHSLFGTDGVRGKVGCSPITPDTIMKLGWAVGRVLSEPDGHVLIGKDTRISGYLLESALEAGFSAAGMNISLLGPMPTPGIAYLTRTARACAGVVISASHNPYWDNGIKIFSSDGTKLSDDVVKQIDEMMNLPIECVDSANLGKAERFTDAQGRYIEYCKSTFPNQFSLKGMKIVLDCANGAAYDVAPRVFSELGAELITIANQPDGFNINENCGSMDMKLLQQQVLDHGADIGVALDGDADRVLLVDKQGNCIDGDQILYVLAKHKHEIGALRGGVVGTVMTNIGLEVAYEKMGVAFKRSKVGDRFVYAELAENQWQLGGESSGHIIDMDKSFTGDGIVTTLGVLEVMLATEKALHQLLDGLHIYCQEIINVPTEKVNDISVSTNAKVIEAIENAQTMLGKKGRVVTRASGTEPLFRVMVEGESKTQVTTIAKNIATQVSQVTAKDS